MKAFNKLKNRLILTADKQIVVVDQKLENNQQTGIEKVFQLEIIFTNNQKGIQNQKKNFKGSLKHFSIQIF